MFTSIIFTTVYYILIQLCWLIAGVGFVGFVGGAVKYGLKCGCAESSLFSHS